MAADSISREELATQAKPTFGLPSVCADARGDPRDPAYPRYTAAMNVRLLARFACGVIACGGLWFAACVEDLGTRPATADSGLPSDSSASGDTGNDSATDGGVKPPACDMTAPFTNIHAVAELNTLRAEQYARLSANELEVWFSSTGFDAGNGTATAQPDLFHASRSSITGVFSNIKPLSAINSDLAEQAPTVVGDRTQLVYASQQAPAGLPDLYLSTRAGVDAAFPPGIVLVTISAPANNDMDPYLTPDEKVLYFASDRSGSYMIYRSQRQGGMAFGAPDPVPELSTNVYDRHPVISADGLWIYWASTRNAATSKGLEDIYVAHRATAPGNFVAIANVAELNTADNDAPSWISPDGCRLYFERGPTAGASDIWVAERALP